MAQRHALHSNVLLLASALLVAACTGSDPVNPPDPTDPGGSTVAGIVVAAAANTVDLPGTVQVTATISPSTAPQSVTWSSSDPAIATVSSAGLVTTLLTGSVVITATSTVNPAVSGSVTIGIECPTPRAVTSNISANATWENWVPDPVCFDYVVQTSLSISTGTLTVEPGTIVGFEKELGLRVTSAAGLVAAGTEAEPIVLTGTTAERGFWKGVSLEGRSFSENVVTHTTIQYTGGASISQREDANLMISADVTVRLEHSTLRHAEGYGLFLGSGANVVGGGNNRMTSNSLGAAYVAASEAEHLKPGGDLLLGNDVDVVTVDPNRLDNEHVWPSATYRVLRTGPQELNVFGLLTLSPGTEIRIVGDQAVLVWNTGGLNAVGTASNPIRITGDEAVPGHWRGMAFVGSEHASNALEHVIIEYGGSTAIGAGASHRANLTLGQAGAGTISRVRITNSSFRGSADFGIYARLESELVDFTGNSFTGNVAGPMVLDAPTVADIKPGNNFTGNVIDEITVRGGTGLGFTEPTTWIDPGVPYHVIQSNSPIWVIAGQTFTVEPGVEMLFGPDIGVSFSGGARLVAEGTEQNRITMRAKSSAWRGIDFQGSTGSLDYIDVLDGGSTKWGGVNEAGTITIRVGFMSAGSQVMFTGNVTLAGVGFGIVFGYGETIATGCPGSVYIPPPDTPSMHCRPPT